MNAEEKIEWIRLNDEHEKIMKELVLFTSKNILIHEKNISNYEIDIKKMEFIVKLEKKENEMAEFAERHLLS